MSLQSWKEIAKSVSWDESVSDWSNPIKLDLFDGNSTVAQFRFGPLTFPVQFRCRDTLGLLTEHPNRWAIRFHEEENNVWLFDPPECEISFGPEDHENVIQHLLDALFVLSEAVARSNSWEYTETSSVIWDYLDEIRLSRQSGAYVSGIFLKQENAIDRILPRLFSKVGRWVSVATLKRRTGVEIEVNDKNIISHYRYHLLSNELLDAKEALVSPDRSFAFSTETAIYAFLRNDVRVLEARLPNMTLSARIELLTALRDTRTYRSGWQFWRIRRLRKATLRLTLLDIHKSLLSCETDWEKVSALRGYMGALALEKLPLNRALRSTIDQIFELPDPVKFTVEEEEHQERLDYFFDGKWNKQVYLQRWRSK